jgi:hypothetical protein
MVHGRIKSYYTDKYLGEHDADYFNMHIPLQNLEIESIPVSVYITMVI